MKKPKIPKRQDENQTNIVIFTGTNMKSEIYSEEKDTKE